MWLQKPTWQTNKYNEITNLQNIQLMDSDYMQIQIKGKSYV